MEYKSKRKLKRKFKILLISLIVSSIFILLGIISSDFGVLGNVIILSTFIVTIPQFFMAYEKYKKMKDIEERFPIFLRDVIEHIKSGMPFHKAIQISSKIDYGELSEEIKKMSHQISWGMPVHKVIDQFAERMKKSRRLNIALKTIRETHISGGDVVSALESVADALNILQESEKERRSLLNQYVVLMYVVCFLFIGIVVAINKLMIPIFQASAITGAGEGMAPFVNPCEQCNDVLCTSICGFFGVGCKIFTIDMGSIACYYTSLFFFMSMIEAVCCGLVAGQIGENSVTAGIKHSIIMTSLTFGAFAILIRLKLLGI